MARYGSNPGNRVHSGILMLGASSTLGGVNFITTVFTMRAPGVLHEDAIVRLVCLRERLHALHVASSLHHRCRLPLFRPHAWNGRSLRAGGDRCLFQHLFWFFGHPEVYVVLFLRSESFLKSLQQAHDAPFWIQINGVSLWPESVLSASLFGATTCSPPVWIHSGEQRS